MRVCGHLRLDAQKEASQGVFVQRLILKVNHDGFGRVDFFGWFTDFLKAGMGQGVLYRYAEVWIELQHLVEQVNLLLTGTCILLSEIDALNRVETLQVREGLLVSHIRLVFLIWRA